MTIPQSTATAPAGALTSEQARTYRYSLEDGPDTATLGRIVAELAAHVARCSSDGVAHFLHGWARQALAYRTEGVDRRLAAPPSGGVAG